MKEKRILSVVMFTDMVGYSKKIHSDESGALKLLAEHNLILEKAIKSHGGNIIKTIGDAFLATFGNARSALQSAILIQRELDKRNRNAAEAIEVRIGLHLGDVVYQENDVFGDGVNIASRIEGSAGPNDIFMSEEFYRTVSGKVDVPFYLLGPRALKNISRSVILYAAGWKPGLEKKYYIQKSKSNIRKVIDTKIKIIIWSVVAFSLLLGVYIFKISFLEKETSRPSLAILDFSENTGDERYQKMDIGKVVGAALLQKFYEYPYIHLVSPIRISRAIHELKLTDKDLSADPYYGQKVVEDASGRLMISGNLKKMGDALIVTAELNDLKNDALLGSYVLTATNEADILGSLLENLSEQIKNKICEIFEINIVEDIIDMPFSELTTSSLDAFSHYTKGAQLYHRGDLKGGAEEMLIAVENDPQFGFAYSELSCIYSFMNEEKLALKYFEKADKFKDRFTGKSKEALIFKGNSAWIGGDSDKAIIYYQKAVELYPDDRIGYLYLGIAYLYLKNDFKNAEKHLHEANDLSPDYFPIYKELAYIRSKTSRKKEAVKIIRDYIKKYPENPGVEQARIELASLLSM